MSTTALYVKSHLHSAIGGKLLGMRLTYMNSGCGLLEIVRLARSYWLGWVPSTIDVLQSVDVVCGEGLLNLVQDPQNMDMSFRFFVSIICIAHPALEIEDRKPDCAKNSSSTNASRF